MGQWCPYGARCRRYGPRKRYFDPIIGYSRCNRADHRLKMRSPCILHLIFATIGQITLDLIEKSPLQHVLRVHCRCSAPAVWSSSQCLPFTGMRDFGKSNLKSKLIKCGLLDHLQTNTTPKLIKPMQTTQGTDCDSVGCQGVLDGIKGCPKIKYRGPM